MASNKKLEQLLTQPMNRRDFLRNIGLLAVSIIGISNAFHILSGKHIPSSTHKSSKGFGSGGYGT